MRQYLALLRDPVVAVPFLASVIARAPVAMAPLGLVLLVRALRDSWELSGLVAGAFAVGVAFGSPVWGRGLDRFGHRRVITVAACTSAVLLLLTTFATAAATVPGTALVVLAALVGLTFPPMSAAMRAAWRVVAPEPDRRKLGYALDAVAVETLFVGGPLLLTALLAIASPIVPLVLTAVLLAGGGTAYALTGAAGAFTGSGPRTPAQRASGHREPPVVLARGVLPAFVVLAAMSIGFGLLDVSLAGLAEDIFGSADSLGFLFAGIAGGSAVGGLLYGAIDWKGPDRRRLPWLLSGFGAGLVAVALLASTGDGDPSLFVLIPVLAVTGLFIAPNLIVLQGVVDETAPQARLGEAQAWLSSAVTAGAATGNALAGKLLEDHGPPQSFAAAAVAVVAAAVLALLAQGLWRRVARAAAQTPKSSPSA